MKPAAALTPRVLARHPLPALDADMDKETRGEVLVIGSSAQVPGAALLTGLAALRAGAGKLRLAVPHALSLGVGLAIPECGVIALPQTADGEPRLAASLNDAVAGAAAIVAGPGLTAPSNAAALTRGLLRLPRDGALILDAAALTTLKLKPLKPPGAKPIVITPHHGEMAMLLDLRPADIARDPLRRARAAAARLGALVILKAQTTYIVTPAGAAWVHDAGGLPGLATSGSGDILAGLLAGLIARGADALTASLWAVATHARAGRVLRATVGPVGFLARELLPEIPKLLARATATRRRRGR